jgi:hypothetical protein
MGRIGPKYNSVRRNRMNMANAFNSHFPSTAESLLTRHFPGKISVNYFLHQDFIQSFSMMRLRNTITYDIEKIIYSLKSKNYHGFDEILVEILKVSTPYALSPLTYIFNKILQMT